VDQPEKIMPATGIDA